MSELSDYFAELYADSTDPWQYEARWYEARKRAVCLSLLPHLHYQSAIELGCSNGVFSKQLAKRCGQLLCIDGQPAAVRLARERLKGLAHVDVQQGLIPQDLPKQTFDLIVVSEILYYLSAAQLQAVIAWLPGALADNGVIVACHWRYPIAGFELNGDRVHNALQQQLTYHQHSHVTDTDFLLTVWQADPQSVAQRENLV